MNNALCTIGIALILLTKEKGIGLTVKKTCYMCHI